MSGSFETWIREHAARLSPLDADDLDDSDLEPLLDVAGDARIVLLGESMHRTHEFLALRNRVFDFLCRRAGFTALVLESGFAEGLAVDRWVRTGTGRVRDLLNTGITYHFGKCQESLDLIALLRERRLSSAPGLQFFGMDLPDSAASALPALISALDLLETHDPAYVAHVRRTLLPRFAYLPRDRSGLAWAAGAIGAYLELPEPERFAISAQLSEVVERAHALSADTQRPRAEGEDLPDPIGIAARAAEIARSADAFLSAMSLGHARDWPPANLRDSAMAESVEWILQRHRRVLVFAANGHVQRTPFSAPPVVPEPMATLGQHLSSRLGTEVRVIGTTYGGGEAWLHRPDPADPPGHSTPFVERLPDPDPSSLDAALSAALPDQDFLVDLRTAPASAARQLDALGGTQNGPYLVPAPVRVAFDAVFHIARLSPWNTWIDGAGRWD